MFILTFMPFEYAKLRDRFSGVEKIGAVDAAFGIALVKEWRWIIFCCTFSGSVLTSAERELLGV
jgi:hypothetical protein